MTSDDAIAVYVRLGTVVEALIGAIAYTKMDRDQLGRQINRELEEMLNGVSYARGLCRQRMVGPRRAALSSHHHAKR